MSKLSKAGKKVGNAVKSTISNPLTYLNPTSFIPTDIGLKGIGYGNGLFGKTPGPENPAVPPNMAYLYDTTKLDPLKDSSKFDFLRTDAAKSAAGLTAPRPGNAGNAATFASRYTAPTKTSESLFNDLIGNINAPSSVDAVRSSVDSDRMKQLLSGIDQDTAGSIGSSKMDFLDRGLGGPGMISDIEANALATTRSNADKLKASTRSDYAQKELDRLKAQEEAARTAYSGRYNAGVASDTQAADIASRGALADASATNTLLGQDAALSNARDIAGADLTRQGDASYADASTARDALYAQLLNARDLGAAGIQTNLFNAGADRQQAGQKPSLFDQLLNKVNFNVGI